MKATTKSNFDVLPWWNIEAVEPSHDLLIAKVNILYDRLKDIPKGYRRDLVINAHDKILRYGKKGVLFHWSHNEVVMLERMYERLKGVR